MISRAMLLGRISSDGVKLSYSEHAKPWLSFTLVCEEPGCDGASYKTLIPVLVVGPQAGLLAEQLEPENLVCLEGKLQYKAAKTKDSSKLMLTPFAAPRLTALPSVSGRASVGAYGAGYGLCPSILTWTKPACGVGAAAWLACRTCTLIEAPWLIDGGLKYCAARPQSLTPTASIFRFPL